jgi:hypothetical protein
VRFGRVLPCDFCNEPAVLQIITVVFDGPSPADQLLCQAHAPEPQLTAPGQRDAATSS